MPVIELGDLSKTKNKMQVDMTGTKVGTRTEQYSKSFSQMH